MKKPLLIFILCALLSGCATPEQRQRLGYALSQGAQDFSNRMERERANQPKSYTVTDQYGMPVGKIQEDS